MSRENMSSKEDLGSAAVRGEAVAKGVCAAWMRPIYYTDVMSGESVKRDDLWAISTDELTALEQAAAPVATTEPTERDTAIMHVCQEAARKLTTYAQIYTGDKQAVRLSAELTNIAREFSSPRAADAPSEPSEKLYFVRMTKTDGWREASEAAYWTFSEVNRRTLYESRAADALDSQPTDQSSGAGG